jgi:hypothetical protein
VRDLFEYHRAAAAEPTPEPLANDGDSAALRQLTELVRQIETLPLPRPGTDVKGELAIVPQQLCHAYAHSSLLVRSHARSLLPRDVSWKLVLFARRCAVLAQRGHNAEAARCGLIALAIAGLVHGDVRDTLMGLEVLWDAFKSLGGDPQAEFNLATQFCGSTLETLYLDFASTRSRS